MKQNDELIVRIEKFSNLGTGIAKVDGQVVFVENACPQDEVKVKITKVNKNYASAKVVEIITPSPHRTEPFCPMQKVCGACQMQFIDYDYQLKLKKQIVEDAMRTIGHVETPVNEPIPSPQNRNYRQKIQYPVSQKKEGRIVAGYFKPQTHEIVNIKYCPIQPAICDEIIEFIRENAPKFNITGFNEKKHTGDLRHVVIRSSADSGKCLVTLVVNAVPHPPLNPLPSREGNSSSNIFDNRINTFATTIFENFEEVTGVCINFNSKKTNVILGQKTECICGIDYVEEKILDKTFKIGADTFFQVNPKSAENIFKYVKDEISKFEKPTVLDAYAGIATFGIAVSDVCEKVISVEENPASIEKAKEVLKENDINNVELFAQDTTKYLKSIKRKFDITILDPPRKGCTFEALDEALAHTKQKIVYVSCNPATLARDLKYLIEKGCTVESIQPFDMFCHTYHIENVAIISV